VVLCAGFLCFIWRNHNIDNNNNVSNNNMNNNNNIIKVSAMLMLVRGGSRVSTVSVF